MVPAERQSLSAAAERQPAPGPAEQQPFSRRQASMLQLPITELASCSTPGSEQCLERPPPADMSGGWYKSRQALPILAISKHQRPVLRLAQR